MKRLFLYLAAFLIAIFVPLGCVHTGPAATVPIPGSLNSFDSTAYQTLRTAHDIAQSFSTQACSNNGNKPGCFNPKPAEKTAINQFISDLNLADAVYAAYHNGAQTQAAAQAAISRVQADQNGLPANITGGK